MRGAVLDAPGGTGLRWVPVLLLVGSVSLIAVGLGGVGPAEAPAAEPAVVLVLEKPAYDCPYAVEG